MAPTTSRLGSDRLSGSFEDRAASSNVNPVRFAVASSPDVNHFTLRALAVGLCIGIANCICNTYFILQTGWGSDLSMSSSLLGFAIFKIASPLLARRFTPAENVLVQTVASSTGMVSLAVGFAGVIPALQFLLEPGEGAPMDLGLARLIIWGLGTCLVGAVCAAFLRKQLIQKEKLRFPTGTATALLILVLHDSAVNKRRVAPNHGHPTAYEQADLAHVHDGIEPTGADADPLNSPALDHTNEEPPVDYVHSLIIALVLSACFSFFSYFVPQIRRVPVFGRYAASQWLWVLDPSLAYVGQGAIMGPATSLHVFCGAVLAWGVLSPLASHKGWAAGSIDDVEHGPKGWVMWIALAVLLAETTLSLGWLLIGLFANAIQSIRHLIAKSSTTEQQPQYTPVLQDGPESPRASQDRYSEAIEEQRLDESLLSTKPLAILFGIIFLFSIFCVYITFGAYFPSISILLALFLSLLSSVMASRSLGATDFSPNSGIAKLAQLVFAIIIPISRPHALVTNLLAGSISESGANQGSDIMQDFKTAEIVGASSTAQFKGQIIGSIFGAFISPLFYRLYTSIWTIPSPLFQIPSAYLWLFTARLLTGQGLPPMVPQVGGAFALAFLVLSATRIQLQKRESARAQRWSSFIPSGIAVAIGMYTTPSFSLPRAIGGLLHFLYMRHSPHGKTTVIVIASGLILGEGLMSLVNLFMASLGVPTFS